MSLTSKQRSFLRALAHERRPVVTAGQAGVSAAVLEEIDQALSHHELVKIKLNAGDRAARLAMTRTICEETASEWVQNIGRIAIIYRPARKPGIRLPGREA